MGQVYYMQLATCACLAWFIRSQYAIGQSPYTLSRALQGDHRVQTCVGIPMGTQRVHLSTQMLMEYFPILRNTLNGVSIPCIWNMDEIHHSELADPRPKTMYWVCHHGCGTARSTE
jgi:hypothetical protein